MTELPKHPDNDGLDISDGDQPHVARLRRVYLWWGAGIGLLVLMIVLHLSGVFGLGSH